MTLPPELAAVMPATTADAWPKVAAALPDGAYLAGGTALAVKLRHRASRDLDVFVSKPFDTERVRAALEGRGSLTVTFISDDTLNGFLDGAKVQFLEAASHHLLDEPEAIAGFPVAGVRDILADKLKVIGDRGELRDYYDLMKIEQLTDHRCEQGLSYYLRRYNLSPDHVTLAHIVRALGHLDGVAEDPGLPQDADEVADYWQHRQPQVARSLGSLTREDSWSHMDR